MIISEDDESDEDSDDKDGDNDDDDVQILSEGVSFVRFPFGCQVLRHNCLRGDGDCLSKRANDASSTIGAAILQL